MVTNVPSSAQPQPENEQAEEEKVTLDIPSRKPAPCFLVYDQTPKPSPGKSPIPICQECFITAAALATSSNESMNTDTKLHEL